MVPRLPRVTGNELLSSLRRAGWSVHNVTGSHHRLRHPDHPVHVTVPIHGKDIVHPKTLKSIPREANMTVDRLRDLL